MVNSDLNQKAFEDIRSSLNQLETQVSNLFNEREVLSNVKLSEILSCLEFEVEEAYLSFTDVSTAEQFLKIYQLKRLGYLSDIFNELHDDLCNYDFNHFSPDTQDLSSEVKATLLTVCQRIVKLYDLVYKQKK